MRYRVNLLGVGGVGCNVLRHATCRDGWRRYMFRIYDPDTVELHNLNRTSMFEINMVGKRKVDAVFSRLVFTCPHGGAEAVSAFLRDRGNSAVDGETDLKVGTIIDARDTMDPAKMVAGTWVKLAYNGGSELSFTWRPDLVAAHVVDLGRTSAYEVVPSFYVPAALLAVLTFNFLRFSNFSQYPASRAGTWQFDLDEAVRCVSYRWDRQAEQVAE